MGQEKEVGDKSTLEDNWDVGGVEEFDVVSWGLGSFDFFALNVKTYLKSLKN